MLIVRLRHAATLSVPNGCVVEVSMNVSSSQATQATNTTAATGSQCCFVSRTTSTGSQTEHKFPGVSPKTREYSLEESCIPAFPANSETTRTRVKVCTSKPYVCTVCKEAFREKRTLDVHTRKHNRERPYICTICHKGFA